MNGRSTCLVVAATILLQSISFQAAASEPCASINGPIAFHGRGIYLDSANVVGGLVPNEHTQYGQMFVGGAGGSGVFQRNTADGSITMSIDTTDQAAQVAGTAYISQQTQVDIRSHFAGKNQDKPVCVSGIAINFGRFNNHLFGGLVYLYVNGTNQGYVLVL